MVADIGIMRSKYHFFKKAVILDLVMVGLQVRAVSGGDRVYTRCSPLTLLTLKGPSRGPT